jgi:hypothetical protein
LLIVRWLLMHFKTLQARRSPLKQRHVKLADVRSRAAAAAAAALTASQSDSERSAVLAARMLGNMQAAEQRRLEVQQAQRARLTAKSELIISRLVSGCGSLAGCWLQG